MIELFVCGSYFLFLIVLFLMIPDTSASGVAATDGTGIRKKVLFSIVFAGMLLFQPQQLAAPAPTAKRKRRSMNSIFHELGDYYTRRAYRMDKKAFWKLHKSVYKEMGYNIKPSPTSKKKHKNGARNGLIPSPTRLSCAIRYFAGGAPYDIALSHGISVREVYISVWRTVNAVNKTTTFDITFPNHKEQEVISKQFKKKSRASFDGLVGCIDGMLLWMEQPNPWCCSLAGVGPKKFFCGRKKKFGLNFTAVVDIYRRFVYVDISHPGATSDYLAFASCTLKGRLENGLLAAGKYIFGDNAYVNTKYMVTPYRQGNKLQDNYNFYHSQLRITVECAFGMLIQRWSILRRPLPSAMGVLCVVC